MNEVSISSIVIPAGRRQLRGLEELARSIETVGLLNPITITPEHRLVAGYHRIEAFKLLGRQAIPACVLGLGELDAALAEVDENLVRNDLTVLERAEHLLRRKQLYEAKHPVACRPKGGRRTKNGETVSPFSEDAATKTGFSQRLIQQDLQIATGIPEELREKLRGTSLEDSKRELLELARLDLEKQARVVQKIAAGESENVKHARRVVRGEDLREQARVDAVDGVFPVILADPPWRYENDGFRGVAADHYPTLSIEEINDFRVGEKRVGELSAENAILLLWATFPLLPEALKVIEAWGFGYRTRLFTWDKEAPGNGFYSLGQDEVLLLGIRGGSLPPARVFPSLVRERKGPHSRKPEEVYRRIDVMWPGLRKLELFARGKTRGEGWVCCGNEVECTEQCADAFPKAALREDGKAIEGT